MEAATALSACIRSPAPQRRYACYAQKGPPLLYTMREDVFDRFVPTMPRSAIPAMPRKPSPSSPSECPASRQPLMPPMPGPA